MYCWLVGVSTNRDDLVVSVCVTENEARAVAATWAALRVPDAQVRIDAKLAELYDRDTSEIRTVWIQPVANGQPQETEVLHDYEQ